MEVSLRNGRERYISVCWAFAHRVSKNLYMQSSILSARTDAHCGWSFLERTALEVGMTGAELNGGDEMLDVGVSFGPAEVVITANGMNAKDTSLSILE
jgi:hypothetical protein